LRAESQRGGAEPLQLITVSDRRAPAAPSRRAWWVVPLLLAGIAGGFAAGRVTAPTKQVIVTVTLPATTAQPTSTARTTVGPTLAPAATTVGAPVAITAAPVPTTPVPADTTLLPAPETVAEAAATEPPVVSSTA
jgi:hypothetical protein